MRSAALLFTVFLLAAPIRAQEVAPSSSSPGASPNSSTTQDAAALNLPVSLDRIRGELDKDPALQLRVLELRVLDDQEQPHFKIEVRETRKLEDLLATLNFKSGPTPAGGIYAAEQQRLLWPSVDNPLRQPYAAFNQPELLTVLIENLVGKYFVNRAISAVTSAERAQAEAAARAEVRRAVGEFCVQQPDRGAGIAICSNPLR